MASGTITITNIGVFGMDAGTPILNPGEAGIIAMGAIRQKPWVIDGEVRPAWVTTVSGSFDHRIVDGDGVSSASSPTWPLCWRSRRCCSTEHTM